MERYRVGLTAAAVLLGLTLYPAASHAVQQTSGDAALHLRVAMKAVDEGEFEIALDEMREAAKLAPTDPVIQFAMATILDKREKVDEALAALDKAQTLGLPEAYREKADDLRVTLLYKQKKNVRAASAAAPPAPPAFGPSGSSGAPRPAGPPGGSGRAATPSGAEPLPRGGATTTLEERFFGPRPMPLPVPGPIVARTVTKENGKYSVKLPDGRCIVEFELQGFSVQRFEVLGSEGASIDVKLSVGVGDSNRLVSAGRPPRGPRNTAKGTITDGYAVIPGVTVTVYNPF